MTQLLTNHLEVRPVKYRWLLVVILAVWAAASLGIVIQNTLRSGGGNDLYTYWIAGHFIRQGDDPYKAFLDKQVPHLPVHYLDGEANQIEQIIQPGLVPAPGYTYPFLLFFTLFAFLSWETAKWVWLIINIGLAILAPILTIRILPEDARLPAWLSLAVGLAFLGFSASRYALTSGQVTFLVLDLMCLAVLLSLKQPWLAGLLLGLALSKYSVSAGILLFFVFLRPNFRLAVTAVAVQAAGILALMINSGTNITGVLSDYTLMFTHHAPMDGIHLASVFPISNAAFDIGVAGLLTWVVFVPLWRRRNLAYSAQGGFCAICIMMLWSLLVAYHRAYDAVALVILLGFAASVNFHPEQWGLRPGKLALRQSVSLIILGLLLLPAGSAVRSILPESASRVWIFVAGRIPTLVAMAGLLGALWIYDRLSTPKNLTQSSGDAVKII
jgi:hypothetical protein